MRGRDDAHVDLHGLAAAHGNHRARLQHAEHLGLEFQGHLGDLVEKEGSSVGRAEEARMVAVRAGERPLHVTEELTLQQGGGEGRTVEGFERSLGAR